MKNFLKAFFSSAAGTLAGILFVFLVIPSVIVMLFGRIQWSARESIEHGSVLHILLDGRVVDGAPSVDWLFEDGQHKIRLQKVIKAIRTAKDDSRIIGAVLDIRSPSMGWASATAIRREIEAFRDAKKFVYAYSDRLDERDLYLSSAAEKSFLQPNGDIEFNGLATEEAFLKGLFAKLEVQPVIFRVGRFKSAIEPLILDKMSPENREQISTLLGDLWTEVRNSIAKRAKATPEQIDTWVADLSIQSAADAKKAGLITDLLYSDEFDDVMKEAAKWGSDKDAKYVSVGQMVAAAKSRGKEKKKIALVIAEGEIVKGEGGPGQVGDDTILSALSEIEEDTDVAAVVLRVNSPGGDALASDVIWRQLAVMDEDRPVVASMGDVAASGGYYISAGARHIVVEPTTITGSIGVFGVLFNAEGLLKNKLSLSFDRVATHPYADYGGVTRALAKKESDSIQAGVERTYKRFIEVVAESRGFEDTKEVEKIAEGRVWSGTRAVSLGLADELGGLDRALAKAAELGNLGEGYSIEVYPKNADRVTRFLEQLTDESSHIFGSSAVGALDFSSLLSQWDWGRGLARAVVGLLRPQRLIGLGSSGKWLERVGRESSSARQTRPEILSLDFIDPTAIR